MQQPPNPYSQYPQFQQQPQQQPNYTQPQTYSPPQQQLQQPQMPPQQQWNPLPYPPPPESYKPPLQTLIPPMQPPTPPKKRMRRTDKIVFAVIGAVVSIFILAIIISEASTSAAHDLNATATANANNLTATTIANNATVSAGVTAITSDLTQTAMTPTPVPPTPTATPTPTTAIGSTQDIGTWVVTLNKVYRAASGDYVTPKAGDIFIIVDVTAINEAATPELISSAVMFVFQDETGQAYQETITGIGVPPDGTIPAGGKLRGEISYEVPTSLHNFTLEFQDSLYNGNTGTWSFSV